MVVGARGRSRLATGARRSVSLWLCVALVLISCSTASSSTPSAPSARSRWIPPLGDVPWQWELDHPLRLGSASDMGTGVTTYQGTPAPDPVVYDIDGFDNPPSTVASLHARGAHVVCYIEVGAIESYRPDAAQIPASARGRKVPDYPQERYLDIRRADVVKVMKARIAMCASKGFDAVETDIDESYGSRTGFPLTKADEERFMTTLARFAHDQGLSWWIKNPDDTGDSYAADMAPLADAVLTEQCNEYSTCQLLSSYVGRKAVFDAEYDLRPRSFCPADDAEGFNGARWDVSLSGGRKPCR
jgi:hypothetical protein